MIERVLRIWKSTWVLLIPVIVAALFFPIFWLLTWITGNNTFGAVVAAICMYVLLPVLLLRRWSPGFSVYVSGPGRYLVEASEIEIIVTEPNGFESRMKIEDIAEIAIQTDDSGPLNEDVWWLLIEKKTGRSIVYPNGAIGEQDTLKRFNEILGFDDKAVITAMGSTSVARFVCWRNTD